MTDIAESAATLSESVTDVQTLSNAVGATKDSLAVAAWTIVSRATGVLRVAAIGAVLGPTYLGNAFQFTNSLPNLVYYGFLAGSLFSSLLVPALVRHLDLHDRESSERVAGGFFGVTLLALLAVAPVAILLAPLVLKLALLGGSAHGIGAAQERVGRWLVAMLMPQVFLYAVVGTATAVMNSRRRFALAAAAPALENIGTLIVLGITALAFPANASVHTVSTAELLVLGLGTTAAVALHAGTQWWGAKRAGVVLVPRAGWRDPEVRVVIRRAIPSLAQAGLVASQVLTILAMANSQPGGVVAFQIALNFYYLPLAIGATPVALSLMPRLARLTAAEQAQVFRDTLVRGISLAAFIVVPAAAGYLALSRPLAESVSFGRMDSAVGVATVAHTLAALAPGILGQAAFTILTYSSYARKDTRRPLGSMLVQAATCLALVGAAVAFASGTRLVPALGLALSTANLVGAGHLAWRLRGDLAGGLRALTPGFGRLAVGAVAMAGPAWLVMHVLRALPGRGVVLLATVAATAVGLGGYLLVQALLHAPELAWLLGALGAFGSRLLPPHIGLPVREPVPSSDEGLLRSAVGPAWWLWLLLDRVRRPPPLLLWRLTQPVVLLIALALGVVAALRPRLSLAALVVVLFARWIWQRPARAAYVLVFITPLSAGIDRGLAIPLLRPNEAVFVLVAGILSARGVLRLRCGGVPRLRLESTERALLLLAITSSVVPLLWLAVQGKPISADDVLYSLVLWKYLGLYALIRLNVSTLPEVLRCLWLSIAAATIVAVVAVLQSVGVHPVLTFLSKYYAPFGNLGAIQNARGSSLLSLPAATADLMIFNLAVVIGLWLRDGRRRALLAALGVLFALAALSSGEFSSAIGLVIGVICVAIVARAPGLLMFFVPTALIAGQALRPVIQRRLSGFQSVSGLPVSWSGRLHNLRSYFWPQLFSHYHYLLGVRPSARVVVTSQATGYVWIESGYTWLLWGGGLPLLFSFGYFVKAACARGWQVARGSDDARSVPGIATVAAVVVVTVLMLFDPHLTYRGAGDYLFTLLALTGVCHALQNRERKPSPVPANNRRAAAGIAVDRRVEQLQRLPQLRGAVIRLPSPRRRDFADHPPWQRIDVLATPNSRFPRHHGGDS